MRLLYTISEGKKFSRSRADAAGSEPRTSPVINQSHPPNMKTGFLILVTIHHDMNHICNACIIWNGGIKRNACITSQPPGRTDIHVYTYTYTCTSHTKRNKIHTLRMTQLTNMPASASALVHTQGLQMQGGTAGYMLHGHDASYLMVHSNSPRADPLVHSSSSSTPSSSSSSSSSSAELFSTISACGAGGALSPPVKFLAPPPPAACVVDWAEAGQ